MSYIIKRDTADLPDKNQNINFYFATSMASWRNFKNQPHNNMGSYKDRLEKSLGFEWVFNRRDLALRFARQEDAEDFYRIFRKKYPNQLLPENSIYEEYNEENA